MTKDRNKTFKLPGTKTEGDGTMTIRFGGRYRLAAEQFRGASPDDMKQLEQKIAKGLRRTIDKILKEEFGVVDLELTATDPALPPPEGD